MMDNAPTKMHDKFDCAKFPAAPKVPDLPVRGKCPEQCDCPGAPGGEPQSCLDDLIREQHIIVKKAERAKAFADELTEIQNKVKSAQVDYTQARFTDLRKTWKEQDVAIVELIRKLVCAVDCWQCLLECRLCKQLGEIRRLEQQLDGPPAPAIMGTGPLAGKAYSLLDQQAWHGRNVAQMEARLKRITDVMAVWQKPSDTIGGVLEKNANLIKESQNLIASDSAKVVYDVFMTLIPRHWAVRPRDDKWKSAILPQYIEICGCPASGQPGSPPAAPADGQQDCRDDGAGDDGKPACACDDGIPDVCCGPDVGIPSLRERLIGPLPYLVDPAEFSAVLCCLTTHRLSPASVQLAEAQANLAAATAQIELVKKQIEDRKAGIEASFREALPNPLDCADFKKKGCQPPAPAPTPPAPAPAPCPCDTKQSA